MARPGDPQEQAPEHMRANRQFYSAKKIRSGILSSTYGGGVTYGLGLCNSILLPPLLPSSPPGQIPELPPQVYEQPRKPLSQRVGEVFVSRGGRTRGIPEMSRGWTTAESRGIPEMSRGWTTAESSNGVKGEADSYFARAGLQQPQHVFTPITKPSTSLDPTFAFPSITESGDGMGTGRLAPAVATRAIVEKPYLLCEEKTGDRHHAQGREEEDQPCTVGEVYGSDVDSDYDYDDYELELGEEMYVENIDAL